MSRKDNSRNPLQIRIEALSIPARMRQRPDLYLKSLLNHVRRGEDLPRGMEVAIHWRNPRTKHGLTKRWREDDFESAIADSSAGFRMIVEQSILKKLRGLR